MFFYDHDETPCNKSLFNILYADDTSILLSGRDLNKLIQELNTELVLVLVTEWLKANKLTLNIEKTYYIVFHCGRRKTLNNIKLQMDDKIPVIKESPHIKYLGVILDNKLNWIEHIGYVKN